MTIYKDFNYRVFEQISSGARVLDVGCATGSLGQEIKKFKSPKILIGIEKDELMAKTASKFYNKMLVEDLDTFDGKGLTKNYFDFIILADVLEHLNFPEITLKVFMKFLKKNGKIIISLPNTAFFLVRLGLLFGYFGPREHGILDRTHKHFFTLGYIKDLVSIKDLRVEFIRGYINTRSLFKFADILAQIFPGLFAYQFLVVVKKTT